MEHEYVRKAKLSYQLILIKSLPAAQREETSREKGGSHFAVAAKLIDGGLELSPTTAKKAWSSLQFLTPIVEQ